jgi:DNA modification methylase
LKTNIIYHADCLEKMKEFPDNSIDLIITDPPYKIVAGGSGGCFGTEKREYHAGVKALSDGFKNEILDESKRILKKMNFYTFCSKEQILQILQWTKDNDFYFDLLAYHKTNPIPTCNNKYLSDTEYIIYIRESGAYLGGSYETKRKFYIQKNAQNDIPHDTVKPLNIIENLVVNSSRKGEIILDPYIGSGTTAIAALNHNRKFIGIENKEKYVKLANKRLVNHGYTDYNKHLPEEDQTKEEGLF